LFTKKLISFPLAFDWRPQLTMSPVGQAVAVVGLGFAPIGVGAPGDGGHWRGPPCHFMEGAKPMGSILRFRLSKPSACSLSNSFHIGGLRKAGSAD
jgi:hypothetical protein